MLATTRFSISILCVLLAGCGMRSVLERDIDGVEGLPDSGIPQDFAGSGGDLGAPCGHGGTCDPENLGGETCALLGAGRGTLLCDPVTCTFDLSMCTGEDIGTAVGNNGNNNNGSQGGVSGGTAGTTGLFGGGTAGTAGLFGGGTGGGTAGTGGGTAGTGGGTAGTGFFGGGGTAGTGFFGGGGGTAGTGFFGGGGGTAGTGFFGGGQAQGNAGR